MTADLASLCVAPGATIFDVFAALDRGGCEIVFVVDERQKVLGTISDGDVRRGILRGVELRAPGGATAVLHQNFVSVDRAASRADVLDLMRARGVSQVPILDDAGHLVGIHMLRDILGAAARPNAAVIMAGGQGMRLRPLTVDVPKPMLSVAGRPILERLVLHLVGSGIRQIYISVNYLSHVIEKHFGDGSSFGCSITYLHEDEPLGTGGALSLLPSPPTAPILVMNGDLVAQPDIGEILVAHEALEAIATLCVRPYRVDVPYGVADAVDGRLVALREKPSEEISINAGIYVLSPSAVAMIPRGVFYPITKLFEQCLADGKSVATHRLQGEWIDVGQHDELRKARGL